MHPNPPFLCTMASPPIRPFCPVNGFWATNRGRLTHGGLLFTNTSANNFNQRLKRVTRDLNYEDGRLYPSHAFRRGDTHEIINSGSTFPAVLKSGIWTSGGYKCYMNLHADEEITLSALPASAMDSDSADPDTPPTSPNDKKRDGHGGGQKITKKRTRVGHPPTTTFELPMEGRAPSDPSESPPLGNPLTDVSKSAVDLGSDHWACATLFDYLVNFRKYEITTSPLRGTIPFRRERFTGSGNKGPS